MNTNVYPWVRNAVAATFSVLMLGAVPVAMAEPKALDNSELADVVGGDGISIILDLQVHADQVSRSFNVDGVTTHATLNDVGGSMLALGITVDVQQRPDVAGATYIDIGMPGVIAFKNFGFRSSGVQTDLQTALPANQNLGGVQLNGMGAMTGHFLMWAQ